MSKYHQIFKNWLKNILPRLKCLIMEDHCILRWIDGYYFVIPPKPWDIKLGILHKPCIHILSVYCWCYLLWFIGSPEQGSCELFWSKFVHCPLSWSSLLSSTFHIVINFSHFHHLLQNHWVNFNQTWHKASLGKGDSSLFKWRTSSFSKGR